MAPSGSFWSGKRRPLRLGVGRSQSLLRLGVCSNGGFLGLAQRLALAFEGPDQAILGICQRLVVGSLGIPRRLRRLLRVADRSAHAQRHLFQGPADVLLAARIGDVARRDAQLLVAERVAHQVGHRLELGAEAVAGLFGRVAGHEHRVAAAHQVRHMAHEHLRGQTAFVYRKPIAFVSDVLVRGVAELHLVAQLLEERLPQLLRTDSRATRGECRSPARRPIPWSGARILLVC